MTALPWWVQWTHLFHLLFFTLLVRSGIEILAGHPKLYWNDDATPGSEWARFTRKEMLRDELWTAEDEAESYSPVLALPGRNNLGLGRHWHFWSVAGWVGVGALYVALLAAGDGWRRLVPQSTAALAEAWDVLTSYARLEVPAEEDVYNPLQQLTYAAVVFVVSPLMIATGIAMSPALGSRFPWLPRFFGGHQAARSLHFLGLVILTSFVVVHLALVVAHGFGEEVALAMPLADDPTSATLAALAWMGAVAAVHAVATWASLSWPMRTKLLLDLGIDRLRWALFHHWTPRENLRDPVSPSPRVNGRPPRDRDWQRLRDGRFRDFRLHVDGLVERPLALSLDELARLGIERYAARHVCIQGWTYIAEWAGTPVAALLDRAGVGAGARYAVFYTFDDKWEAPGHGYYYEAIDLRLARRPRCILAFEVNRRPLPLEHGAPLRLRCEGQLGYKMAKWVRAIELVPEIDGLGAGQGGWRDDVLHYYRLDAGI